MLILACWRQDAVSGRVWQTRYRSRDEFETHPFRSRYDRISTYLISLYYLKLSLSRCNDFAVVKVFAMRGQLILDGPAMEQ